MVHTTVTRAYSFTLPSIVKLNVHISYWSLACYHGFRLHQSPFNFFFLTAPAFWTTLKLRDRGARFTAWLHPVSTSLYTVRSVTSNYPHIPTETLVIPCLHRILNIYEWSRGVFTSCQKFLRRVRSPDNRYKSENCKLYFKLLNLYQAAAKNCTRAIMQFIYLSVTFNTQNVSDVALAAFVAS